MKDAQEYGALNKTALYFTSATTKLCVEISRIMGEVNEKVVFASKEWMDLARNVMEELVAKHGEIGKSFSVSEVFTDAPIGLVGPDEKTAAWYMKIVDKTVIVGEGVIEDADMPINADYQAALPMARMVYTSEMVALARKNAPQNADRPKAPDYLIELHNRLANLTQ